MTFEMKSRGPIFDGSAERTMREMSSAIGEAVADEGVNVVRAEFSKDVQHPTGKYSSRLHAATYGAAHKVTDGDSVYGPWLAGKSRRNKISRFKGYTFWRRSVQQLQRRVKTVAAPIVARYLRRL